MTIDGSSGSLAIPGSDINGDGNGDIVWQHAAAGQRVAWYMDGTALLEGSFIEPEITVPAPWKLVGAADYNFDGQSDLLWHQPDAGQLAVWYLDNQSGLINGELLPDTIPTEWQAIGVGDFNSDQKSDILWTHQTSGELAVWYMDGFNLTEGEIIGAVSTEWQVKAIGDFNGDSIDDLIWYNSISGDIAAWFLDGISFNGNAYIDYAMVGQFKDTLWEIKGSGDFNTDGYTDLLWWHRLTGDVVAWYLEETTFKSGTLLNTISDTQWSPLSQVRGGKADLAFSGAVVPPTVVDQDTVNVNITLVNQGSKTSVASTLKYYLSNDATFDGSDTELGQIGVDALLAGESTNVIASFVYDANLYGASGTKHLILQADSGSAVAEGDETNNELIQSFEVIIPPEADIDLTPQNAVIPTIWTVGAEISMAIDVANQGLDVANSSRVFVYLLDSPTIPPGTTPILFENVGVLGGRSQATIPFTFTYLEEFGVGEKYLAFVADADGVLKETDEGNNVTFLPITVASAENSIDFLIQSSTAPASIVVGQPMTVTVNVFNQGATLAPATRVNVYVSDYVSPDDELNLETASSVGSISINALAAASTQLGELTFTYSPQFGSGQKNIFFVVDVDNAVTELNESNNTAKLLLQADLPEDVDLVVVDAAVSPNSILPGGNTILSARVYNPGTVATGATTVLRAFLSTDQVWDETDEQLWGTNISSLDPNSFSSPRTFDYTYPATAAPGTKYILFVADATNTVFEKDETNNITVVPLVVNVVQPGIDLLVTGGALSTNSITVGETMTVNATVQNQGDTVSPTSTLGFYLSEDNSWDASDVFLGDRSIASLATYATGSASFNFTYLEEYGLDGRYVLAVADSPNLIDEGTNEGNNGQAFAFTALPDLNRPDVIVSNINVTIADLSAGIAFNYFITNQGLRQTTQPFTVKFYISSEPRTDRDDVIANSLFIGESTPPAESAWGGDGVYDTSVGFEIGSFDASHPLWSPGARYLITIADFGNAILESNETNNIASFAVTLS